MKNKELIDELRDELNYSEETLEGICELYIELENIELQSPIINREIVFYLDIDIKAKIHYDYWHKSDGGGNPIKKESFDIKVYRNDKELFSCATYSAKDTAKLLEALSVLFEYDVKFGKESKNNRLPF